MNRGGRTPALTVGTVVWLSSELMFFSGLFAAYFTLRAASAAPWPPESVELEPTVAGAFTAVLVLSSFTMQMAVRAAEGGRRQVVRNWLLITFTLAAVFVANQAREWSTLEFSIDSHAFGSAFYVMTGFHGLHVIGGMVAMIVLAGRSFDTSFDVTDAPAVEVVSYYWHFVDVVWVGLYSALFLLR